MMQLSVVVVVMMMVLGSSEASVGVEGAGLDVVNLKRELAAIAFNRTNNKRVDGVDDQSLKLSLWDIFPLAETGDDCDPTLLRAICPFSPNGCPPTSDERVTDIGAGYCECNADGDSNMPTANQWVSLDDDFAYYCIRLTGGDLFRRNFRRGENGGKTSKSKNSKSGSEGVVGVRGSLDQDWVRNCKYECLQYCDEVSFACFILSLTEDPDKKLLVRDEDVVIKAFCTCACPGRTVPQAKKNPIGSNRI